MMKPSLLDFARIVCEVKKRGLHESPPQTYTTFFVCLKNFLCGCSFFVHPEVCRLFLRRVFLWYIHFQTRVLRFERSSMFMMSTCIGTCSHCLIFPSEEQFSIYDLFVGSSSREIYRTLFTDESDFRRKFFDEKKVEHGISCIAVAANSPVLFRALQFLSNSPRKTMSTSSSATKPHYGSAISGSATTSNGSAISSSANVPRLHTKTLPQTTTRSTPILGKWTTGPAEKAEQLGFLIEVYKIKKLLSKKAQHCHRGGGGRELCAKTKKRTPTWDEYRSWNKNGWGTMLRHSYTQEEKWDRLRTGHVPDHVLKDPALKAAFAKGQQIREQNDRSQFLRPGAPGWLPDDLIRRGFADLRALYESKKVRLTPQKFSAQFCGPRMRRLGMSCQDRSGAAIQRVAFGSADDDSGPGRVRTTPEPDAAALLALSRSLACW